MSTYAIANHLLPAIIEKHALQDLHTDSINLLSMVTDQVAKLSKSDARTRKAVEIFGHLGHASEPTQVTSPGVEPQGQMAHRTLPELWQDAIFAYTRNATSNLASTSIDALTTLGKNLGAHGFLLTLLIISTTMHLLASTSIVQSWYNDRNAVNYMSRLGVTSTTTMAKAVYLHDLTDMTQPFSITNLQSLNGTNHCSSTFRQLLATTNAAGIPQQEYSEPSTRSTAHRLHKTRQRMASYRHDLLVSLRLVNSIERETVQAEYENWVVEENVKCEQMRVMLQRYVTAGNKMGGKAQVGDSGAEMITRKKRLEQLREVQRGYCGDCRAEQAGLERLR